MSSIFSDPWFRRGTTLLSGEQIELDTVTGNPIAGNEIAGQVKAFQDVNPVGKGDRFSNRLVYCVAARYKGADTTGSALRRTLVAFSGTAPLSEFSAAATKTNVADGRSYGVVDEYLSDQIAVRTNDIVWIVVKGPTTVAKEAGASGFGITAGNAVVVSNTAGSVTPVGAASAGTINIGENLGGTVASTATTVRVNLWSDRI